MARLGVTILSFLISLIIFSCSQDVIEPVAPGNGDISLDIDQNNIPLRTATLQIELSRQGFDNIEQKALLNKESSWEVLLKDIPSGEWNLKARALDEKNEVISSGKAYLNVAPFKRSNVTKIDWEILAAWVDYPTNPVFHYSQSPENPPFGVHSAKIIFENNIYKMWYTNVFFSAATTIGYAESDDGKTWKNMVSPVLIPGTIGQWDSRSVQIGAVIKVGELYRMYYTGYCDHTSNWNIGIALSADGHNWQKLPNPVIFGDSKEFQPHVDDVIFINGKYHMYYTIRNPGKTPFYSIGMAISDDGLSWTKYAGNPILLPTDPWEDGGVYFPTVIADSGKYKMAFMNATSFGFGFASSADGLTWEKDSGNPFFNKTQLANNWASEIAYPYLRKFNGQYYLYYSGLVGIYSIGLAIM